MTQNIKFAAAVFLVVGICVIFFSPLLDLQPTTVRHLRPTQLQAAVPGATALGVYDASLSSNSRFAAFLHGIHSAGSLVDLNCTRLC